jgi:DNA-binding PadR family transcriptional regulator
MPEARALTPTSYAVLGLLAIRSWTTYELATQLDRTLSRFWPRARSKLYEEPKKLVEHGLAQATVGANGRRPRTVYTITPSGRTALAGWLATDSAAPVFESEHVLKVFYAEQGSTTDLLATLAHLRAWVHERTLHNISVGSSYERGEGPYPDRVATLQLTGRFLDDYLEMLDRWAARSQTVVASWPDEPGQALPDPQAMTEIVAQASARARRWEDDQRARQQADGPRRADVSAPGTATHAGP